jgi:hypothetical protein
MNIKILAGIFSAIGALAAIPIMTLPRARFTVHVVDEGGAPIADAKASFAFGEQPGGGDGVVEGLTDSNGNFTAGGVTDGSYGGGVTKDGYYSSGANTPPLHDVKDNEWQPYDATFTCILRKIEKPIPMYARKLAIKVPGAISNSIGFDLEEADWVAPYGKGKVADLIVTFTDVQYRNDSDYEASATLTFSNDGDGIQEVHLPKEFASSYFKWPREAPEIGYQPKFEASHIWQNAHQPVIITNTSNENQTYFFRVRTEKQGDQITSALYGKIKGGFYISPDKSQHGFIEFTYYLNPTPNDRNMEWDPTKNLAPTPKDISQRVRDP